ncbi:MAG: EamA family transporter, partial [Synergistes sp.]|nr:EamA family transporter [Synergistes sp.]
MSISKKSLTGIICVVTAGVCWGTTGTIQAFMPAGVSPLAVGSVRAVFSGTILLAIMTAVTGGKIFTGRWDINGVLVAALGLAGYQLTFFTAVKLTGVAVGTMV